MLRKSDDARAAMEAFVFGHSGSTASDVALAVLPLPLGLLLLRQVLSICSLAARVSGRKRAWLRPSVWPLAPRLALEFVIVIVPPLLALTIASAYSGAIVAAEVAAAVGLHVVALAAFGAPLLRWDVSTDSLDANGGVHALWLLVRERHHSFISSFRSGMMLLTCISILAVDFSVFPRRHAKTENSGISLVRECMAVGEWWRAIIYASSCRAVLRAHSARSRVFVIL